MQSMRFSLSILLSLSLTLSLSSSLPFSVSYPQLHPSTYLSIFFKSLLRHKYILCAPFFFSTILLNSTPFTVPPSFPLQEDLVVQPTLRYSTLLKFTILHYTILYCTVLYTTQACSNELNSTAM